MTEIESSRTEADLRPIVVGADGSAGSQEALRWAGGQARATHTSLLAVMSWRWPDAYGYAAMPSDVDWERDASEVLVSAVRQLSEDFPDVQIEQRLLEGRAAPLLIDAARSASLLVVGSRGHGAFAGMLLGSVSEHCVRQAPCPVVVVRGQAGDEDAPGQAD